MTEILSAALPGKARVIGFDRSLFGPFTDFASMCPEEAARIFHTPAALPAEAGVVLGHFAFSTLTAAYPDAQLVTVLREPETRLLSHWLFWRQHTDAMLEPVGGWGDYVRLSRQPLADFLMDERLAAQVDNVALRMLLWPDPRIAADRFIAEAEGAALLAEAEARLDGFAFADILEDIAMIGDLGRWLGTPLPPRHVNETEALPEAQRSPLAREMTDRAFECLRARARLDRKLWQRLACRRMSERDAKRLRRRTLLRSVARYGGLMAS